MTAFSTLLLTGTRTVNTTIGQYQQAGAVLASGRYNKNLADWNAQQADQQAADATARGEQAAQRQGAATRTAIGSQRAVLAAQGVDVASGSAVDIQSDTAALGALDALTIRQNAAREAYGYTTQAAGYRQQGIFAGLEARNQAGALKAAAGGTLLKGAADVYDITHPKESS